VHGGKVIRREIVLCRTMEGTKRRMTSFPGTIYDGQGRSLDLTVPDLLQEQLDAYPHHSMVADRDAAPIARVWLLADDATFAAINPVIATEAIELVLAGKAIVILGRRLEPAVDVRDGLLDALDLHTLLDDVTGQA
jgi:hypothetical protein